MTFVNIMTDCFAMFFYILYISPKKIIKHLFFPLFTYVPAIIDIVLDTPLYGSYKKSGYYPNQKENH